MTAPKRLDTLFPTLAEIPEAYRPDAPIERQVAPPHFPADLTPAGVPVEITSPGCKAKPAERVAISCGMVKIRSRVLAFDAWTPNRKG